MYPERDSGICAAWWKGEVNDVAKQEAAFLLTYICLFVVLHEFSKLEVPSNNGDLEGEIKVFLSVVFRSFSNLKGSHVF